MKKKLFIVLSLLSCICLFSSCGNKVPKVGDIRDSFPEVLGSDTDLPEDTEYMTANFDDSVFESDVNIYYGASRYSSEYEKDILKKLGYSKGNIKTDTFFDSKTNEYEKGNDSLSINKEKGSFFLYKGLIGLDKITDIDYFNALGESKLKEFGFLPDSYSLEGYVRVGSGDLSDTYSYTDIYGPRFAQRIDDKVVIGAGSVWIAFNSNEEIAQIKSSWLDPIYAATAKTLSYEEAYARIGGSYSYIDHNLSSPLTKVVFDNVQLVYYKNPDYDYYIPMFRFEGTAYAGDKHDEIFAYVIAIENLTDDMIINQ